MTNDLANIKNQPLLNLGPSFPDPGLILEFKKVNPEAIMPRQAYERAVGLDLAACLMSETGKSRQVLLPSRNSRVVETGLILIPPPGYFIAICSRSGLASRNPSVFVANSPGIIDPDYTGEIKVILYNGGNESVNIKHGDFIAQAVLLPAAGRTTLKEIEAVPTTLRADRGFGSSDQGPKV